MIKTCGLLNRYATSRKNAGSSPDEVIESFQFNISSGNIAMGWTRSVTEMSTRNLSGGKAEPVSKTDKLTATVSRLSRQCGIFNISQPYRPPRPVTGIALLYGDGVCFL
jgi:hypothetical protein